MKKAPEVDKLVHFFYASNISFMMTNSLKNVLNVWIIFGITALCFLLFEVGQKVFKKGQFDWMDWGWGTFAALLITITAFVWGG